MILSKILRRPLKPKVIVLLLTIIWVFLTSKPMNWRMRWWTIRKQFSLSPIVLSIIIIEGWHIISTKSLRKLNKISTLLTWRIPLIQLSFSTEVMCFSTGKRVKDSMMLTETTLKLYYWHLTTSRYYIHRVWHSRDKQSYTSAKPGNKT